MKLPLTILVAALTFVSCDNTRNYSDKASSEKKANKDFTLADTTLLRLKKQMIDYYKSTGDSLDLNQLESNADEFIKDFIEASKSNGDTVNYFNGIFLRP